MLEICFQEAVLGIFASFLPLTDITIDSTRSSGAMSVGDVSVTAAKCTSEKVLRSLLPSLLAWQRRRCQTASTSSQLAS